MGPAGLTAVFGMGTGGAPQVSSPEWPRLAVRRAGTESEQHVGPADRARRTSPGGRPGTRTGLVSHRRQRSSDLKTERSGGSRGDPSVH